MKVRDYAKENGLDEKEVGEVIGKFPSVFVTKADKEKLDQHFFKEEKDAVVEQEEETVVEEETVEEINDEVEIPEVVFNEDVVIEEVDLKPELTAQQIRAFGKDGPRNWRK